MAVMCCWDIKFTDVSSALPLAEAIGLNNVYPPETENLGPTKVWRLNKAAWIQHLASVLETIGWERSVRDECVI